MKTMARVTSDSRAAGAESPSGTGGDSLSEGSSEDPQAAPTRASVVARHYVAVAPDGTRFTRATRHTYSHAVLVWCESWRDRTWKWHIYGFAGSAELAAKLVEVRRNRLVHGERLEVVGAQEFSPLTPRQREFLDQIGERTIEMFGASYLAPLAKRGLVERKFIGARWWRVRRTEAGRRALVGLVGLGDQADQR
jgi:hypothetical protein